MIFSHEIALKLYAHCVVVKGVKRSTISNLETGKYEFIPNSLHTFIELFDGVKIGDILSQIDPAEHEVVEEYLAFLEKRGYAFFTDIPDHFPKLPTNWDSPSIITNAIVDIGNKPLELSIYQKVLDQLCDLSCQAVQIRMYSTFDYDFVCKLLRLNWSSIKDIQLFLKYGNQTKEQLYGLYDQNIRTSFICFHSAPHEDVKHLSQDHLQNVYYITSELNDASHCGNILKSYFSNNIATYTESLSFNSCLNRKVGIDVKGNIKNCPSLARSFGNIQYDNLIELVKTEGFQQAWGIKKDEILDCKVCEFRYMCTDCRLGENGVFEMNKKPKKCNYDPYTARWN